jgi:hypothetical protein
MWALFVTSLALPMLFGGSFMCHCDVYLFRDLWVTRMMIAGLWVCNLLCLLAAWERTNQDIADRQTTTFRDRQNTAFRERRSRYILANLATHVFNGTSFEHEAAKLCHDACAICLSNWEPQDRIKLTPCGHAFHEECLRGWIMKKETCALCRKDLNSCTSSAAGPTLRY